MKKFKEFACVEKNSNWERLTERNGDLYSRDKDTRNPFQRDYTRILHSQGYRRLKHKTQVFLILKTIISVQGWSMLRMLNLLPRQ